MGSSDQFKSSCGGTHCYEIDSDTHTRRHSQAFCLSSQPLAASLSPARIAGDAPDSLTEVQDGQLDTAYKTDPCAVSSDLPLARHTGDTQACAMPPRRSGRLKIVEAPCLASTSEVSDSNKKRVSIDFLPDALLLQVLASIEPCQAAERRYEP